MPFFSKVFKGGSKETSTKTKAHRENGAPKFEAPKPKWDDAWQRTTVEPEEVQELLRGCTQEIKARALDTPFLILPFRPASDPSAAKTFIRNFFGDGRDPDSTPTGYRLTQEIRLAEPLVLCSVVKWCWGRLARGVVTWEAYELFTIGEKDSNQARDAFKTFIPMSVASQARERIIFDFFELLAAMAAHSKVNGLGGRKLSRLAGWWAFEHADTSKGFDGGYKSWTTAADATSHLFFAYLRSLTPKSSQERSGVSLLPRALEGLLGTTEYPPVTKAQLQSSTSKVVMIVETVSPTPFALLRRAKHFQYRDEDRVLQNFSDFDNPEDALTDECGRVLRGIASANATSSAKTSTSLRDPSWSRFEDIGFSSVAEEYDDDDQAEAPTINFMSQTQTLQSAPQSRVNLGRPTTPSWAEFLSTGFADEKQSNISGFLPPDKILPPINTRQQSSHSQRDTDSALEPGELANITVFDLDDAFWWAWISSLAGEEPPQRKAVFGRCALVETRIFGGSWLVIEETVKGTAPQPETGAYVAEKKSRFTFGKLSRSKSSARGANMPRGQQTMRPMPSLQQPSKTSVAPDQQAKIQAAAAALQEKNKPEEPTGTRRGRIGESSHQKTQSVATLQPIIMKEAAPALRWANSYDKNAVRAQYLGNDFAGRGSAVDLKEVLNAGDANRREAQSPVLETSPIQQSAPKAARLEEMLDRERETAAAPPPPEKDVKSKPAPAPAAPAPAAVAAAAAVAAPTAKRSTPPPPVKTAETTQDSYHPQAAAFFAQQLSPVQKPREESNAAESPKPVPVANAPPPPQERPPPPPSEDKPAQQQRPAQRVEEQKAAPSVERPVQRVEEQKAIPPQKQSTTDLSKTTSRPVGKENEPPLQKSVTKTSVDQQKPPSTPDQSARATATEPPAGAASSPETGRSDRNRLQKKGGPKGGKGLKSIFGLKKHDDDKKKAEKPPVRSPPSNSSSVAAARAALEAKARESQVTSPTPSNKVTTKRYSTAANKGLTEAASEKPTARVEPRAPAKPRADPQSRPHGAPAAAAGAARPTSAVSSLIDPAEEERAQQAFSAFDQGGLEPNTPTRPEYAMPSADEHAAVERAAEERATREANPAEPAAPRSRAMEPRAPGSPRALEPGTASPKALEAAVPASKPTEAVEDAPLKNEEKPAQDEPTEATPDPSDRWAQIRKNAAERAHRMSEEQSGRTERTDEDGETDDGEETIESRVARIKARVAELTGNMDPPSHRA